MKTKITVFCLSIVFLLALFFIQQGTFSDNKLHIVFCDVGQGDAILIKTPSQKVILYDSGPGSYVLDCLNTHLPFWQRTIDLAILSHPHTDHYQGFYEILQRYTVKQFSKESLDNKAQSYQELITLLREKNIPTRNLYKGDSYTISDGVTLEIVSPTKEYISEKNPQNFIGQTKEFPNIVLLLSYKDTEVLLTGDSQANGLKTAIGTVKENSIDIFQVPHHGSKTGLDQEIIDIVSGSFAIVSVGTKNRYNHPHPSTIQLLQKNRIKYLMTKDVGDIEIISDGKKYQILK